MKEMLLTSREDVGITTTRKESAEAMLRLAEEKTVRADKRVEYADRTMRSADRILMDAKEKMEEAAMLVRQNDRRSEILDRFQAESKADKEIVEAMISALEKRMPIADANMFEAERRVKRADELVDAVLTENSKLRQELRILQAKAVVGTREDWQGARVNDVVESEASDGSARGKEANEVIRPSKPVSKDKRHGENNAQPSEFDDQQSNEIDVESLSDSRVWLVSSTTASGVRRDAQVSLGSASEDASTMSALRPEGGHSHRTTIQTKTMIVTGNEDAAQNVFNKLSALGYDLDIALLTNSDWRSKRHTAATIFREGERKILVCTLDTALRLNFTVMPNQSHWHSGTSRTGEQSIAIVPS